MCAVAGVFAVTTPFEDRVEAEVEQGRAVLVAARRVRVPHLVATAKPPSKVAGEVAHTILGPTYFFDNALGDADRIRDGVLDLPLPPDRPLQQLARPDLGAFTAEVLLSPAGYVGQRIELASDAPTPAHMAHALGAALGHPVRTSEPRWRRAVAPTCAQCGSSSRVPRASNT